ncbi:ABC transporter ATP-binding protein [Clostridium sp. Marseille-Q2269]|uniref:ABC transporter ATP-binding protein n=1 Tax=Clostridium sp. Marseille-Q2269 TaxID=2942205 RepID=UPI002073E796|nr:ABC transporter ATP-binding protein [Clostridium sp. Marseille-Q2269]
MIKKYTNFYKEYLHIFTKNQIIGMLILIIYSASNIIYPYFLKLIIDDAITNKDLQKLLLYTSIMIVIIGISILFRYIKTIYFFNLGKKISIHIKNKIISKIFQYNLVFFRNYKVGEIISILEQDVINIQTLFMNVVNDIFINVMTFIGLTVILTFLNFRITVISLIISGIYLIFQRRYGKGIKKSAYKTSIKRGEFQSVSQEMINSISNIQLQNQSEYFQNQYNESQNEYFHFQFIGVKIRAKSYILDGVFEGMNLILVLFFGGLMILKGYLTVGSLFTMTLYVQKLFTPIVALINDYIEFKKTQASIDRVYEILENEQYKIKFGEINCGNTNTLKIKKISFSYNETYLFDNVNLEMRYGEKIGIVGENGSGKSTLMNLILKLEDNFSGNILLGDYDIREFNKSYYDKILLIKQEPFIFNGSILDNLIMGEKNIKKEKINEALSLANIKEDIEVMEKGVNTIVGEKGVKLSGGQCQKLALARIFLSHEYPIIILDEPTAALDLESEEIVLRNIFKYRANSTIIVITHRREVLKYCTRVIEIKNKNIFDRCFAEL